MAFRLRFDGSGVPRTTEKLDLEHSASFALLGCETRSIGATIEQELSDDVEYVPALAIRDVIAAGTAGVIGGYLNLARLHGASVEIYSEWRNPGEGLPRAYADDELGHVGEWRVTGIHGL